MRNEPWVWPEVGDAGTSGAGAVPLRSAQLMGQQQQQQQQQKRKDNVRPCSVGFWQYKLQIATGI